MKRRIGSRAVPGSACARSRFCVASIMAIELPLDFKGFLRLLDANRVDFLLIGGYAVGYHGYPRVTGDIDIWIAHNPANAQRMITVQRDFGLGAPEQCLADRSFLLLNNVEPDFSKNAASIAQ